MTNVVHAGGAQTGSRKSPADIRVVNVMLVDDRTMVREGLSALIQRQPDLAVVAHSETVGAAASVGVKPDVIVTDIELPDARNGQVIAELRRSFPQSSILVLTLVGQPAIVQSVVSAGADGYLLKTAPTADLLAAIRALARGTTYLQASIGVELVRLGQTRRTASGLLPQQEEFLRLIALGHTNAEIARLCGVSLRTVESHRRRIRQKLGRGSRAELVHYARNAGLLDHSPIREDGE